MIVRQAANVLDIMEFFAQTKKPATLAEIADHFGWPRSSTFNLLATLSEKGYLYEPRPRAGFYPTPRWLAGRVRQDRVEQGRVRSCRFLVRPIPRVRIRLRAVAARG